MAKQQKQGQIPVANLQGFTFVIQLLLVYAVWKALHHFLTQTTGWLNTGWLYITYKLGTWYAAGTSTILNCFNAGTLQQGIAIVYPHWQKAILVQDHCLAIPAMVIFSFSVALFSGSLKNKTWFIPVGLLLIVLINVLRLAVLSYIYTHYSAHVFLTHHSIIFVGITYTLILALFWVWINFISCIKSGTR